MSGEGVFGLSKARRFARWAELSLNSSGLMMSWQSLSMHHSIQNSP